MFLTYGTICNLYVVSDLQFHPICGSPQIGRTKNLFKIIEYFNANPQSGIIDELMNCKPKFLDIWAVFLNNKCIFNK